MSEHECEAACSDIMDWLETAGQPGTMDWIEDGIWAIYSHGTDKIDACIQIRDRAEEKYPEMVIGVR